MSNQQDIARAAMLAKQLEAMLDIFSQELDRLRIPVRKDMIERLRGTPFMQILGEDEAFFTFEGFVKALTIMAADLDRFVHARPGDPLVGEPINAAGRLSMALADALTIFEGGILGRMLFCVAELERRARAEEGGQLETVTELFDPEGDS